MTMIDPLIKPAPVRKTVTVKGTPDRAFEVFTAGFDRWWPRSHHTGPGELKEAIIEPKAGGRWYEINTEGEQDDWGHVIAWDPPGRLVLAWQLGSDFKYDPNLVTEVEVSFTDVGGSLTRVDLEHRQLERMGERAAETRVALDSDGGWGGILAGYADTVAA